MIPGSYFYLNRDLSWLSFNGRVLQEAADPAVPLYNRFLFLSIFSSNLDEFYRVRVPAITAFSGWESKKISLSSEYPNDLIEEVLMRVNAQQEEYGRILREELIPALGAAGIHLYYGDQAAITLREKLTSYFLSEVLSFLQPLYLSPASRGTIFLENNALYFVVSLENAQPSQQGSYALVNIPSGQLPRFYACSGENGEWQILFLDDIIRGCLPLLFRGAVIKDAWSVKLTRDAELNLEDEFEGDLALKIERQLEKRDWGPATRLLTAPGMPEELKDFLASLLEIPRRALICGGPYHNLKDFASLPLPDKTRLSDKVWPSVEYPYFGSGQAIFTYIREREHLLHFPYHSYGSVLRFFNEAATDPLVKEICITLYRVAPESRIVNALISAARNGKTVTVFVELKARFDEANNLKWSKKMKAAGIRIISSLPYLKVHAKVALVKREEEGQTIYYSSLGTGNFNENTARFYTDHMLLSDDPEKGKELDRLFRFLVSGKQPAGAEEIPFRKLLVSQFNLVSVFENLIQYEIEEARAGREALIFIKLNNLQERRMIDRLYEAAAAGVKIKLLVRGICCLAPGLEGQSENITVVRIVDRYLEHARIFFFHHGGEKKIFMGSADWMKRNLCSRIEVCFPLEDPALKEQAEQVLQLQWADRRKARLFTSGYENLAFPPEESGMAAQEAIYHWVCRMTEK